VIYYLRVGETRGQLQDARDKGGPAGKRLGKCCGEAGGHGTHQILDGAASGEILWGSQWADPVGQPVGPRVW